MDSHHDDDIPEPDFHFSVTPWGNIDPEMGWMSMIVASCNHQIACRQDRIRRGLDADGEIAGLQSVIHSRSERNAYNFIQMRREGMYSAEVRTASYIVAKMQVLGIWEDLRH